VLGAIWSGVRSTAPLALFALVLIPGCYESFPAERTDAGDAGLDGEVILPDGSAPIPDVGPPPPPPNPCTTGEVVPDYEGPGCSGTTVACLATCSEPGAPPTCTSECIDRDPECRMCVNETLLACGNRRGCQDAWNAYACCAHQRCPSVPAGADRLACAVIGECVAELNEYFTCLDAGAISACQPEVQVCFGGP